MNCRKCLKQWPTVRVFQPSPTGLCRKYIQHAKNQSIEACILLWKPIQFSHHLESGLLCKIQPEIFKMILTSQNPGFNSLDIPGRCTLHCHSISKTAGVHASFKSASVSRPADSILKLGTGAGGKPNIPPAELKIIRILLGYSVGYNIYDQMLCQVLYTCNLYLN